MKLDKIAYLVFSLKGIYFTNLKKKKKKGLPNPTLTSPQSDKYLLQLAIPHREDRPRYRWT